MKILENSSPQLQSTTIVSILYLISFSCIQPSVVDYHSYLPIKYYTIYYVYVLPHAAFHISNDSTHQMIPYAVQHRLPPTTWQITMVPLQYFTWNFGPPHIL